MRLIDADKLLRDIEHYNLSDGKFQHWVEIQPTVKTEPRWIPCSERLPDGVTQVIIQTNGEAIHEAIYMGKDDYGHYVWRRPDNEIYWDEEVVAWKPLPEPYMEEDE